MAPRYNRTRKQKGPCCISLLPCSFALGAYSAVLMVFCSSVLLSSWGLFCRAPGLFLPCSFALGACSTVLLEFAADILIKIRASRHHIESDLYVLLCSCAHQAPQEHGRQHKSTAYRTGARQTTQEHGRPHGSTEHGRTGARQNIQEHGKTHPARTPTRAPRHTCAADQQQSILHMLGGLKRRFPFLSGQVSRVMMTDEKHM